MRTDTKGITRATVSARLGMLIAGLVAARGEDAQALLDAAGCDPAWLADPDARMPLEVETRLWESAAQATRDPYFGLNAARTIRPGVFQVLDYAVRTAPDLRTALERLARYNRLMHDLAHFELVPVGETVRVEHRFDDPAMRPCRHASEFTLASLIVVASQISGEAVQALAVALAHPAPGTEMQIYRSMFGVTPSFGASISCLVFSAQVLERPVPSADPELSRIVTAHAERLLAAREPCALSLRGRVQREVVRELANGTASLDRIARTLNLSTRSLQRRLSEEGCRFADVLDEVRRSLALQYIADERMALGELAYMLGYSEPSAFHRAFKRWTGMTPQTARRQHR